MINAQVSPSPFLTLLKQIASGISIYEPPTRTGERAQDFHDTIARLKEMERLGLVGRLSVQTRSSSGEEQVDMVMVIGGLTEEGWRLLHEHSVA